MKNRKKPKNFKNLRNNINNSQFSEYKRKKAKKLKIENGFSVVGNGFKKIFVPFPTTQKIIFKFYCIPKIKTN